jgi:uncharacterized surface protein with fasciclin (FAS1) repeats
MLELDGPKAQKSQDICPTSLSFVLKVAAMKISRRLFVLTAAAGAGALLQACGGGDDERAPNIVETLQANAQFSILVEAVVAADLVAALSVNGPLTVFAPTNAAFADLLGELGVTKEALLASQPLLTQVLTHHVLNGRVLRARVPVGAPITTLEGSTFTVDSNLRITDARGRTSNIVDTDVITRNGVIHVIDKVLLPAA